MDFLVMEVDRQCFLRHVPDGATAEERLLKLKLSGVGAEENNPAGHQQL